MYKNLLVMVLAALLLVSGCTTVIHPGRPGLHHKKVWVPGHHKTIWIPGNHKPVRGKWVPGHWIIR